jgi:hypothetical protein
MKPTRKPVPTNEMQIPVVWRKPVSQISQLYIYNCPFGGGFMLTDNIKNCKACNLAVHWVLGEISMDRLTRHTALPSHSPKDEKYASNEGAS